MKTIEEVLIHIEEGIEHFEKRCNELEGSPRSSAQYALIRYNGVADSLLSLYHFINGKSHKYSEQFKESKDG